MNRMFDSRRRTRGRSAATPLPTGYAERVHACARPAQRSSFPQEVGGSFAGSRWPRRGKASFRRSLVVVGFAVYVIGSARLLTSVLAASPFLEGPESKQPHTNAAITGIAPVVTIRIHTSSGPIICACSPEDEGFAGGVADMTLDDGYDIETDYIDLDSLCGDAPGPRAYGPPG
jgi:hypothetical protein